MVGFKASSEELEKLKQLFLSLDTSKDGTLSVEELKEGMERIEKQLGGSHKVTEYQDLMASLDKDGNGVIDYAEFLTGAIDKASLLSKQNLLDAFKLLDSDNSGMISVDELKQAFDTHGDKKDEALWLEIMREVDKNGDNEISFEEFQEAMTALLRKKHL